VHINTTKNDVEGPIEATARPIGAGRIDRGPRPFATPGGARRRALRNAAVAIKANSDGLSYAEIIKQAKEKVNLKELGISNPRMRRAANGGVLIEIPGPEGALKADTLAAHLRDVIGGNAVVSRPVVKADIRITDFDESVIKNQILTMTTELGGCLAGDVRVGSFRPMRNGLNMDLGSVSPVRGAQGGEEGQSKFGLVGSPR